MIDMYTPIINTLVEQVKGDKSLDPEWRNRAISHFKNGLASIRMAQTTTRQKPPGELEPSGTAPQRVVESFFDDARQQTIYRLNGERVECICTPGMPPRKDCPVHGSG